MRKASTTNNMSLNPAMVSHNLMKVVDYVQTIGGCSFTQFHTYAIQLRSDGHAR